MDMDKERERLAREDMAREDRASGYPDSEPFESQRLRMMAFDLPTVLRCARRYAHLSQREVSIAAGVNRRTLERL